MSTTTHRPDRGTGPEPAPGGWGGAWAEVRRRGPRLLLVAVVLFAVTGGFGLLLVHGLDASVGRWDLQVEESLVRSRTAWLDSLTGAATWLAETMVVIGLTVLAVAVARWATRTWRAPVFIALSVLGEKTIYLATSLVVDRPRPPVPTIGHVYATTSFPSGHVGAAVALYGGVAVVATIWRRGGAAVRPITLALALGAPVAVGFARMYRGFHYPTDVVAGALVGVLWLAATWVVVLRPGATVDRDAG